MAKKFKHRPRQQCPLAPAIESCISFGREASCALCALIDFEHPTTCDALGRYPDTGDLEAGATAFWAHLARRTDGGPSDAAELYQWNRRKRDKWDRATDLKVRQAVQDQSPLPDEPPF